MECKQHRCGFTICYILSLKFIVDTEYISSFMKLSIGGSILCDVCAQTVLAFCTSLSSVHLCLKLITSLVLELEAQKEVLEAW